jgi:hypothetical protein
MFISYHVSIQLCIISYHYHILAIKRAIMEEAITKYKNDKGSVRDLADKAPFDKASCDIDKASLNIGDSKRVLP